MDACGRARTVPRAMLLNPSQPRATLPAAPSEIRNPAVRALAIFDRRPEAAPIEERTRFEEAGTRRGRTVTLLRA
jgi:hypothetical protein